MDGGAWWAAIYGVTQSRTRLMRLSSSSPSLLHSSYSLVAVLGLLIVVASLVVEHGLSLVVASGGYSPVAVLGLLIVVASLVAGHGL